jgi:hypothetical protein
MKYTSFSIEIFFFRITRRGFAMRSAGNHETTRAV